MIWAATDWSNTGRWLFHTLEVEVICMSRMMADLVIGHLQRFIAGIQGEVTLKSKMRSGTLVDQQPFLLEGNWGHTSTACVLEKDFPSLVQHNKVCIIPNIQHPHTPRNTDCRVAQEKLDLNMLKGNSPKYLSLSHPPYHLSHNRLCQKVKEGNYIRVGQLCNRDCAN